ncbi:serine/threonine-protein kinase [Kineosporia babensis]|uniref:non-specific serine/threonine protein kinase n=1 Tax=Kineosporia babensis TaxID=499548 RepID=A0A9X1SWA9_9ACTN|nr:protein kinase [Kineosporia babensis]
MPDVAPLLSADPAQVAGYRLTGRIGAGGQGVVYLGLSPDNELVAVKMLRVEDERSREQFAKEVAAARRVAPFCTAQILDFDLESQPPYVISEFIEGPSLQQYISERGPMSGTRLQRLAIGTATALAAIHQAGVVHRDLKPANVMMSPEGPRVIDFGIARDLSQDTTKVSKLFGTPAYMSPEQLRGERVGPATDLFAWGSVMAFAATGRAPFEAEHMMAAIAKIANEHPDLSDVPGELRNVLLQCLDKDASRRPTAQHALSMLLGRPNQPDVPDATVVLAQATQLVEASPTGPTSGYEPQGRTVAAGPDARYTQVQQAPALDETRLERPQVQDRRPTGTSGPVSPSVPSGDVPPWGTHGGREQGVQQNGQYSQPQKYPPPAPAQPHWGPQHGSGQHGSGPHGFGGQQGSRPAPSHPAPSRPAPQGWNQNAQPAAYQPPQSPQWGPPNQPPNQPQGWGQPANRPNQGGPRNAPPPPMPGPAQRVGSGAPARPTGWNQQQWGGGNGGGPNRIPGQGPNRPTPPPNRGRAVVLTAVAVFALVVGAGVYNVANSDSVSNPDNDSTSLIDDDSGSGKAADPESCGGRINVGADGSDCADSSSDKKEKKEEDSKDAQKVAPLNTLPYGMEGEWEGEVSQVTGTVSTWTVQLDLKGAKKKPGTMEAPGLGCRSKLTITSASLYTANLSAPVKDSDNESGTCAPLGEVTLLQDLSDPDKLTFTWKDAANAGNVGFADLQRVD